MRDIGLLEFDVKIIPNKNLSYDKYYKLQNAVYEHCNSLEILSLFNKIFPTSIAMPTNNEAYMPTFYEACESSNNIIGVNNPVYDEKTKLLINPKFTMTLGQNHYSTAIYKGIDICIKRTAGYALFNLVRIRQSYFNTSSRKRVMVENIDIGYPDLSDGECFKFFNNPKNCDRGKLSKNTVLLKKLKFL